MAEIAKARGQHPLDAFLDLVVEEELNTVFTLGENNTDTEAVAKILGSPYAVVGRCNALASALKQAKTFRGCAKMIIAPEGLFADSPVGTLTQPTEVQINSRGI
ncbi:MAG: hypothetical protein DME15_05110 [Candidatus Rokuibacteriota bacterium]|nr:MAG: hypothetical protein DME15_05110 [Candidatus Rokubacteria bacterium]